LFLINLICNFFLAVFTIRYYFLADVFASVAAVNKRNLPTSLIWSCSQKLINTIHSTESEFAFPFKILSKLLSEADMQAKDK